jgi:hypothetical protein
MNQTSRVTHQDWTGAEVEVPVMCKLEKNFEIHSNNKSQKRK